MLQWYTTSFLLSLYNIIEHIKYLGVHIERNLKWNIKKKVKLRHVIYRLGPKTYANIVLIQNSVLCNCRIRDTLGLQIVIYVEAMFEKKNIMKIIYNRPFDILPKNYLMNQKI